MNNLSENATIIYIPVNEITAHPNNPRKDLGDLTELSESIRKNGVPPKPDGCAECGRELRLYCGNRP